MYKGTNRRYCNELTQKRPNLNITTPFIFLLLSLYPYLTNSSDKNLPKKNINIFENNKRKNRILRRS
jgi:hypothetical protein